MQWRNDLIIRSSMEQEQWRPIEGYEDYLISNHGRVRSLKRHSDRLMPLTKQRKGYYYVMLYRCNVGKCCRVNRLVALHFIPNPDNLPEVNHIDGDKANNHASNLEWCTRSHNVKHSFDTGLKQPHYMTDDERKHLSDMWRGRPLTEETKAKISASLKGRPHPGQSERQRGKAPSRKAIEASIATRKRKAEERRALKAQQPKRPIGRPRKKPGVPV